MTGDVPDISIGLWVWSNSQYLLWRCLSWRQETKHIHHVIFMEESM